jgi:hypothetical protein
MTFTLIEDLTAEILPISNQIRIEKSKEITESSIIDRIILFASTSFLTKE